MRGTRSRDCLIVPVFAREIVVVRWHDDAMTQVVNLLDRRLYAFGQVDYILGLSSGTAKRWVEGYSRAGRTYEPVVRPSSTGDDVVTWGEFVEIRLVAEFRGAGVPVLRMRPVIEQLREELDTRYPLATAKTWLEPSGPELLRRVQQQVGLERQLWLVVARTGQGVLDLEWTPKASAFRRSAEWDRTDSRGVVQALRPVADITRVRIDPLRSFGEPTVRGVRTEIIAELVRAGDSPDMIAELYELERSAVDDAVRYELLRQRPAS